MRKQDGQKIPRIQEYQVLFYRIGLAYLFYFLARLLFTIYNRQLIPVESVAEFFKLCWHGLVFDTTAILYINSLFILMSVLPFGINSKVWYQKVLFWIYFVTNIIAYSTNFVDFIYYRFNFGRSTVAITDSIANESNKFLLFVNFSKNYWHVFLLFFAACFLWIGLYNRIRVTSRRTSLNLSYFITSTIAFLVIVILSIGGIRGDFKKSTRPINVIDASRYVNNISQSDIVLNTPFAIIRTVSSNSFKKQAFVSQKVIDSLIVPIKYYQNNPEVKKNIVIFILESWGREYVGSLNRNSNIKDYRGYTPFVDSLAQHSMIFPNAYANGYKSIHAVSSVLAGIPSFKNAFTSSPYPKQKTESLVSTLESIGYQTSFFHGAPNGSMGFLGYTNILGVDHYFGKAEFNNDSEFDGVWGIWDEPFFQYFNKELSGMPQPFMSTIFSVSSHEPYKVPEKYIEILPKGQANIHQPVAYTDMALRKFFQSAKSQPWFNNTIFVIVGDHGNTVYYDEYLKEFNRHTVAMLIYDPTAKHIGVSREYAQQIDIYPTILDMIGYKKPFRSWGRSLINDNKVPPFVVRYSSNMYQFMCGNYIFTFDGQNAIGFYDKNDKGMQRNLIKNRTPEMNAVELRCKAFIQDYMQRIIDKKLTAEE